MRRCGSPLCALPARLLQGAVVAGSIAPAAAQLGSNESTVIYCTVAAIVVLILGIGLAYARSCLCFRPFRIDERGNVF